MKTEQTPPFTTILLSNQETSRRLPSKKVHYSVHSSWTMIPILSQVNALHSITFSALTIYLLIHDEF